MHACPHTLNGQLPLRPAADKFALRRPWLTSTQRRNVTRELLFFMFGNKRGGSAMEDREQGNLIGSDKVEGTAVYGAKQREDRFDRTRHDRQDEWEGILRRTGIWWLSRPRE